MLWLCFVYMYVCMYVCIYGWMDGWMDVMYVVYVVYVMYVMYEHIIEIVDSDCICAYIVLIVYANRFWNSAISVACIVWFRFKHIHIIYHKMYLFIYIYRLHTYIYNIYILQPNWGSIYWRFQGLLAGGLKYRWGHATRGRGAGVVILSVFHGD